MNMGLWGNLVAFELRGFATRVQIPAAPFKKFYSFFLNANSTYFNKALPVRGMLNEPWRT